MMKLIKAVLLLLTVSLTLMSCRSSKILRSESLTNRRSVEQKTDTIKQVVTDSSMLRLWLECDSLGRVRVNRLQQSNSLLQATIFELENNILDLKSRSQTVYRDRVHTVHDTVEVIQKLEVPVPAEKQIVRGKLYPWQQWLLWIGIIYLLRLGLKIAFNWKSITFKTFFKLL